MECVTLYDWWKLKSIKTSRTKWLAELARGKPLPPNTEFFRVKLWVLKETYKKFRKVSRVFICKSILIIEIKERKNTLKKQTKPREKVCLEPYETMQSYDIQTNLETGLCVWKPTDTRAVILSGWETSRVLPNINLTIKNPRIFKKRHIETDKKWETKKTCTVVLTFNIKTLLSSVFFFFPLNQRLNFIHIFSQILIKSTFPIYLFTF